MVHDGRGTALLVLDVQNHVADPSGSLFVGGGAVVARVYVEVAAARAAGAEIVDTTDWHPPPTPHVAPGEAAGVEVR